MTYNTRSTRYEKAKKQENKKRRYYRKPHPPSPASVPPNQRRAARITQSSHASIKKKKKKVRAPRVCFSDLFSYRSKKIETGRYLLPNGCITHTRAPTPPSPPPNVKAYHARSEIIFAIFVRRRASVRSKALRGAFGVILVYVNRGVQGNKKANRFLKAYNSM